jgi:hypothetical protein
LASGRSVIDASLALICIMQAVHTAEIEPAGQHAAWRIKDGAAFRDRMDTPGVTCRENGSLMGEPQPLVLDPADHTGELQHVPRQK